MAEPIGARHHSMQRLRRLSRRRSARSDEGVFVLDGPTLLAEALDAGLPVDEVVAELALGLVYAWKKGALDWE